MTDLDTLRAAAKQLKKAHAAAAIARLRAVLPDTETPKHADFLHTIAVEHGHPSWPRLKFALETRAMTRDQRAEQLKMALYFGQNFRIRDLLATDPGLADHNLGLQIATYNVAATREALKDPAKATEPIGPRTPLLHLAFSKYIHMAPERRQDMLAIARLLLDAGADPNDGYIAEPGTTHRLSALYGALGHAHNLALAQFLLESGATPNDNETLYHATELDDPAALALVLEHGAIPDGTNALARALDFSDLTKVRLLLEHGADPNEGTETHPSGQAMIGIPALHQAARRGCSGEIAQLLLDHGAAPSASWQCHTPYALARIYGNVAIAGILRQNNAATPLSDTETLLAACADGQTPTRRLDPRGLPPETRRLLARLAGTPGRLPHLERLVLAGIDPDEPDEMGLTPLHVAAWTGLAEHVRYFLTLSPDLAHENAYGGDALGTALHGDENAPRTSSTDHIACVRLLLEAGAALNEKYLGLAGTEPMSAFLEEWRSTHAPQATP